MLFLGRFLLLFFFLPDFVIGRAVVVATHWALLLAAAAF